MLDQSYYRKTDEILANYPAEQKSLIPVMQDIQTEYRYLPPELLSYIAEKLNITEAHAYSVATFYENFSLRPRASMSSKFVTVLPATFATPLPFWRLCGKSWA